MLRALAIFGALALSAPAAGLAQAPFGQLPSAPSQSASTVTAPPVSSSNPTTRVGGLSTVAQAGIFVGAAALIAGIAYVIVTDARAHTPRRHAGADAPRGTVTPRAQRVSRARARARAARRERKRNR